MSEEHLERRRRQILDAARACFIRKGVHETSMQDIFAEAGLSAGAVYRYFKSKNEIIEAITSTTIGDLHLFLAELVQADPVLPLDELMERMARRAAALSGENGTIRLAPQAWSLAMYDPDLHVYVHDNIVKLRAYWVAYTERCVAAGLMPPGTDVEATGKTLFGVLPGFILQRLLLGDIEPEELRRGLRAVVDAGLLGGERAGLAGETT
ncbi:TetR/AcrR family transcriptional regulator [Actinomadura viridis]